MAVPSREQALSLLAAANNHGDITIKLSSLKQAKDILLLVDQSHAAELFPYLVELQSSPESIVRKTLLEVIDEIGSKAMEHSSILMPVLLTFLKDNEPTVAKQSIVTGTNIFCSVLEELQFHRHGKVERWLEELWTWMVKFKDAVFGILLEDGTVGLKLLALKFLEIYVLLFTSNNEDSEKSEADAMTSNGRAFNVSWVVGGHPVLDPVALMTEANRYFGILLDFLRSASNFPGALTISVVNCLAAIARKRPIHYSSVLSTLLDSDPNIQMAKGGHSASIQYSLRTAFLGFLRCTHPTIVESRDRLLRALRAMNAGDAADQVMRQVDKMMRFNGRASRDARVSKDELLLSHLPVSEDLTKKRSIPVDNEEPNRSYDVASKRIRYDPNTHAAPPIQPSDSSQDYTANGTSPELPSFDSNLNPVEQMIAMIGALIAEGERGAESLELLISQVHPDLLADIVITNMKHLPKCVPPLTSHGSLSESRQSDSSSLPAQVTTSIGSTSSTQTPMHTTQLPFSSLSSISISTSDTPASINFPAEAKRDPRRDPRRLDPRRASITVGVQPTPIMEDNKNSVHSSGVQSTFDTSNSLNKPLSVPLVSISEIISVPLISKTESVLNILESPVVSEADQPDAKEEVLVEEAKEVVPESEVNAASDISLSPVCKVDQDSVPQNSADKTMTDETFSSSFIEEDQLSPDVSTMPVLEEACPDLPTVPSYVDLTEEQEKNVRKLAIERIIESYKNLQGTESKQARMALLARLVAQIDADDEVIVMLQKHIISDYQQQKGHELVMHVLYHLHTLMVPDSLERSSFVDAVYEKFLLGVAKSLLDALPATDKSFSRLLGEVPCLPNSLLKLLDDMCYKDYRSGKDVRDGDHVTQGLGAVWSLILGRPLHRQACLDIALKCAVHSQDDIRAKAIRLVANKLYVLNYISEDIEKFATSMFLSAVEQRVSEIELSQSRSPEQRTEGEMGSQEASVSGSQISEPGVSENDSMKDAQSDSQSDSSMSFAQAHRLISLFFALCTKKPILLQLVFDNYSRAPKAVKQAIHRHIPIFIRALGSSYSELFCIISDPPRGSENILTQVLHILSEVTTPSSDLVAIVKRLYETKLKDATILIPMLSSFSKNEVLPIFPRLVNLPLDKFQTALAHILQGSAHTGPALTPAEVLVVIHDINPEKDGIALKKITDVCSACFEQRTVFTQQVLAKALNQMVDQTPLPLLFMRTVIQAIDAFPTLVDFVMEILSKLVIKQVWRMPKLWVGFLKCVSQTQPHSFHVLLQLPSPQLESALSKYPNLRRPLTAYANNQPSIKISIPRSTLLVLGLANESHMQQPHLTSLHASDTNSSVHGTTMT